MEAYEPSATVENEGRLQIDGVSFAPGTRVEVTVSPERSSPADSAATQRLCAALDKGRNVNPIGTLSRKELYDRPSSV